ncbi:MAG: divergent polysaccharide deacetylase family protein, partial [Alphaproteobacteria bacterium]|nr:divergent polysaccharide deacetylase family protein [Alphaproteobacteria bacterium]
TGPLSLNTTTKIEEAKEKLYTILDTKNPISGVVVRDGAVNDDNKSILSVLFKELKNRGLLIVDATSSNIIDKIKIENLPRQKADLVISKDMKKADIKNALKKAETLAFHKGYVLIVADPKPIILSELYKWVDTFSPQVSYEEAKNINISKPFALVPVSNIVVE